MHSHNTASFLDSGAMPFPEEHPSLRALRSSSRDSLQAASHRPSPDIQRVITACSLCKCPLPDACLSYDVYSPHLIASNNGLWPHQLPVIPGISFFTLSSLKDPYTAALHTSWHLFSAHDDDILSLLARSLYQDALFIDIPPNTVIDIPLHILHLLKTQAAPHYAMPRLHISVGKNSSIQIIESSASAGFINSHLTVDIGDGGAVMYTRLDITPSPATCSSLRASVKGNASLTALYAASAPLSRHTATILLEEQGASATLLGLSTLSFHHQSSFKLLVDHQAAHTSSRQLFKGLVADTSLGSFESNVVIRKEAQQSDSHQHSHFLTLGAAAQTVNKPCFDIFADDVIAAHGATSGAIDQEELFYLTSRGLAMSDARRLLIEGFCEEIICKLPKAAQEAMYCSIVDTIKGAP